MASIVTNLLGGGIIDGVAKIISLFKVDPTVALANRTELEKIQLEMQANAAAAVEAQITAQVQVNLAEAQNKSVFIAGWRPAVGWACAIAFGYSYILQPFMIFALTAIGKGAMLTQLPRIDLAGMLPVMIGMLGLGAMRSFDKTQNGGNGA